MSMNPRIDSWDGKYVWVVGASTGIGAATAELLLLKGAHVAVSARRQQALDELARPEVQARILPVALDVTDHASVVRARDVILARWPRIDVVLLVAGGYNEMRADSFDLAAANGLIDLNLRGVFNCLDVALPVDGKVYNVDFDDWLYLIDDRVMLNRASMSKFGFGLGSLTVAFNRREEPAR